MGARTEDAKKSHHVLFKGQTVAAISHALFLPLKGQTIERCHFCGLRRHGGPQGFKPVLCGDCADKADVLGRFAGNGLSVNCPRRGRSDPLRDDGNWPGAS
jgi:hypothetical protein